MFNKITILLVPFVMLAASASHGQGTKAFQQRKTHASSTRFAVPTKSVLKSQGTKPIKNSNSTRFVYPNQKVSSKRLVPMKVYKYEKQRRRLGLAELRNRLYALNGQRSRAKPTPQNNPELKSICDQYRALIRQITAEIDDADLRGRDAEAEKLSQLKTRAEIDARRHGCGYIYLIPTMQGQVMEGQFKVLK